jgi:DNA invertase Pin-like site-specific DNA recombinase
MACTDSTQEASHGELTYQFSPECNYDLTQLNDRLILGLKGTMSEAELFTMRARLQGAYAIRPPGGNSPRSCRSDSSMRQLAR